jgi:hypothetical protein
LDNLRQSQQERIEASSAGCGVLEWGRRPPRAPCLDHYRLPTARAIGERPARTTATADHARGPLQLDPYIAWTEISPKVIPPTQYSCQRSMGGVAMNGLPQASGQSLKGPQVRNVDPSVVDPAAYPCRRPIRSAEIPELRALGRLVRGLRFVDGQRVVRSIDLGFLAQVPVTTLWRIETGIRRTRQPTLQRVAKAASRLNPFAADVARHLPGVR